jgi:hypothetical protein
MEREAGSATFHQGIMSITPAAGDRESGRWQTTLTFLVVTIVVLALTGTATSPSAPTLSTSRMIII